MNRTIYLILMLLLLSPAVMRASDNKQERNLISQGNALYRQQRYAEAETMYKKALTFSPNSEVARYNLSSALIRQSGSTDANKDNTPLSDATQILTDLEANAQDVSIVEKAAYNLGNLAFNQQNYQGAIEHYKNALRKNPDNDKARENLRLAQKKLEEQNKNQDKNQDQNQQNKDQNKDQEKNQNQNQDKDKKEDNKDKQQPDQPQDQKKDQKQNQPQQKQGGISDENAQKILKAMENEEAATRKKVEARKQKADEARKRQVTRPW